MVADVEHDSIQATNARLGAGSVALEALALIGNALTRLEVGEIAVASFGTDCQLLHPFSKPFTADAGAEVVSSFTFSQKETDMVKMVDWMVQAMDIARDSASHGAAEQVQLVFVVTDALGCNPNSLERIRKMTREVRFLLLALPMFMNFLTERHPCKNCPNTHFSYYRLRI